MPQKKKTASSRKRTMPAKKKLAKKKATKVIARTSRSAAKAKAAAPRKRKTASAKKKAAPRAGTKRVTKAKARKQSAGRKREAVNVTEHVVVDTVEEVAPGVLVVKEYDFDREVVAIPAEGGNKMA